MRKIKTTKAFKKDFKKCQKRSLDLNRLADTITALQTGQTLPPAARPHPLVGNYKDYWECHIAPDWLLIYQLTDDALMLYRTGTHSDLFN